MSQALTTQGETQAVVLSRSPFQAYMSQDNEGPYERKHICLKRGSRKYDSLGFFLGC